MVKESNQTDSMPWAIVDASLIYGASRILLRRHDDPTWQYRSLYRREDDQALFVEFLHALLLYERILLEVSSMDTIGKEIHDLIGTINAYSYGTVIQTRAIRGILEDSHDFEMIIGGICRIINELKNKKRLLQIPVPWAYRQNSHHDYSAFKALVQQELRPLAIFAFRGLCYAAYPEHYLGVRRIPLCMWLLLVGLQLSNRFLTIGTCSLFFFRNENTQNLFAACPSPLQDLILITYLIH